MEPTPSADQTASSEPRKVDEETKLATNPKGDESLEKPKDSSYGDMANTAATSATSMASNAAATATATASSMKDNVFSMFGGGPKKEKKEEEEVDEPSGSSKAKKAEAEEDEVSIRFVSFLLFKRGFGGYNRSTILDYSSNLLQRETQSVKPTSTSSPLSILQRRLKLRQTKSKRSKYSRCGRSSSASTARAESGRKGERVT